MDAAGAAREEHGEHRVERSLGVLERGAEDVLHLLVDLVDDREEVFAGVREVRKLVDEELVALLECLELFEGERVHPAELG